MRKSILALLLALFAIMALAAPIYAEDDDDDEEENEASSES
ncbi:MAG: sorting protein [Euryarchaeota archaeon]|nr:sorting protein [Euryarchaeota archaeon]